MTKEIIEYRKLIIDGIKIVLDQIDDGQFQLFCLDFLPMYNAIYQQLERHGGTVTGKTRKGTPDLIKTLADGKQIGVQCSVLKNYWEKPKDEEKLNKWKPISDINDCVAELKNVVEIVLCSNQEIPTNLPNIKSELIQESKDITMAKITSLDRADIERTLLDNVGTPSFERIAKIYFPEISSLIETLKEARENQLAIELRKEKAAPFDAILGIAREAVNKILESDAQKEFALKEINQLRSCFQRTSLPTAGSIERKIPLNLSFDNPCGIIQVLTGVPKIGKTCLGSQLSRLWEKSGLEVRWFECPAETEQKIFVQDLSRDLWELLLAPDKAYELSMGIIQSHSIDLSQLQYRNARKLVYVIDNSEQLEMVHLKQLCEFLALLKKYNHLKNIGLLFLTNKGLKHLCPTIDLQITAPAWTQEELLQFLSEKLQDRSHYKDSKYLEILQTMSSGHPLVALALAQKYPTATQLLLNSLSGPSLGDEDLADGIKQLLFNELIRDSDLRNFVIRLSQLIRAKNKVLISLTKINPNVSTPIKLILEELLGTVIEGTDAEGYSVPFVYKEVAKKQLTRDQQKEIFSAVSLTLLTPVGKTINAEETIDGIFYSFLAENFERAFFWSTMLFQALNKDNLTDSQINSVLDRLVFLAFINTPKEEDLFMLYCGMLLSMAMVYGKVKKYKNALDAIEKIKFPEQVHDERLKQVLKPLTASISLYKVILKATENPKESARIFASIDLSFLKQFGNAELISEIASQAIPLLSIKDITREFLAGVFDIYKLTSNGSAEKLIDAAMQLGLKGSRDKILLADLIKLLPELETREILQAVIECQYYLETGISDSITYAEKAIELFQKKNLQDKPSEKKLMFLLGDVHYKANNSSQAREAYQQAHALCFSNRNFDYAWINWRLGLLSDKPEEAEIYFKNSAKAFIRVSVLDLVAKSYGERSITLVQQNKYKEFADLIFTILKRYYLKKEELFGPTAMVAMAHVTRLIWQIEKKPIKDFDGLMYPDFKRGIYNTVLDIAKPRAGGGIAFYSLSQLYGLLDSTEKKTKCLLIASGFEPLNEMEEQNSVLIVKDLLEELAFNKDYGKIFPLMLRGIQLQKFSILSLPFLSHCIFSSIDTLIASLASNEYSDVLNLLDKIKTLIEKDVSIQNQDWWFAELYSRAFRVNQLKKEDRRYLYELAGTAYKYGLKSNNTSAIIEGGNFYGYPDEIWNMKLVAEIHFNIMKAIAAQNSNLERLQTHGRNLFVFWSKRKYRVLSEHDLQVNKTMRDNSSILLKAEVDPDTASPIMLLLLASLYQYQGEPTKWAVNQIKEKNISIPPEIIYNISLYLEKE